MPHQPDPEQLRTWLAGAARNDGAAFRALYDATSPKLFGFAVRILHKHELAEEALQEAYVSIWHAAGTYQASLSAPMTWMTTIVRNKAHDIVRRLDNHVEIDVDTFNRAVMEAMEDSAAGPARAHELSADAQALAWCMDTLERPQRQTIALAFFHELSHSEVAQQLALPIGTVKTWIRRGLDKLKTCLAQREAG